MIITENAVFFQDMETYRLKLLCKLIKSENNKVRTAVLKDLENVDMPEFLQLKFWQEMEVLE